MVSTTVVLRVTQQFIVVCMYAHVYTVLKMGKFAGLIGFLVLVI